MNPSHDAYEVHLARALAEYAWAKLFSAHLAFPQEKVREVLRDVVDITYIDMWFDVLDEVQDEIVRLGTQADVAFDRCVPDAVRKAQGMYFTPRKIAQAMMVPLLEQAPRVGWVVDASAGAGSLLVEAIKAQPTLSAWGVEKNPWFALATAISIVHQRNQQSALGVELSGTRDRVIVGDGLAKDLVPQSNVHVVVGNPPYLGEKGNAALFESLRREHAHLAEYVVARGDLLYLFMHRGMQMLESEGLFLFLTSAYWVQATGAARLRQKMRAELSLLGMVHVEKEALFEDAPGHHSLFTFATKRVEEASTLGVHVYSVSDGVEDWVELVGRVLRKDLGHEVELGEQDDAVWAVWQDASDREFLVRMEETGSLLGEYVRDLQGFVSGADRWTARHERLYGLGHEIGRPIYLFEPGEVPENLEALGLVRPILRGSKLCANTVVFEESGQGYALYVDDVFMEEASVESERLVLEHLAPFRPLLEARREVQRGRMPWYRMHWPRANHEQVGAKLIIPRRAKMPVVSLDLAGHGVSSDCTSLVARPGVGVRDLMLLMVVLNAGFMRRWVRACGKRKGNLYEFYAQPLQQMLVPVVQNERGLTLHEELLRTPLGEEMESAVSSLWNQVVQGFGDGDVALHITSLQYEDEQVLW